MLYLMTRAPRVVWMERVARWRDSGQSAKEFAASQGLNVWTLRKWSDRLRRENSSSSTSLHGATAAQKPRSPKTGVGPLSFVEVVTSPVGGHTLENGFEVVLPSGVIVRIPTRFEPEGLQRVLAAVQKI